jgi:outer membrane immunogenic protein
MRKFIVTAALLSAAAATPAFAQEEERREFEGFHVGGSVGLTIERFSENETILFDRNLDNVFQENVTTAAGVNAFAPNTAQPGAGFCAGSVGTSPTRPAGGCETGGNELEFSVRAGYDFQNGPVVYGIMAEIGKTEQSSSVSAFSITPASYTITREIDLLANIRARLGYTITPTTLAYFSAGVAFAKLDNSFTTTNTVNSVTLINEDQESLGGIFALGLEQKFGRNMAVGLEGAFQTLADDEFRVRLGNNGTTPAANPFLLGNPNGTDFRRSDDDFDLYSVRAFVNFRF